MWYDVSVETNRYILSQQLTQMLYTAPFYRVCGSAHTMYRREIFHILRADPMRDKKAPAFSRIQQLFQQNFTI